MMQKSILITGGKGYLGGRLCQYLTNNLGLSVTVTSRNSDKIKELPSVNVIKVDTSKDNLTVLLEGFDTIIHLAALDAKASAEHSEEAIEVNIGDTVKWLKAASEAEITQFIYFSTVHVYGDNLSGEITETTISNPIHPYSITHKCAEDYVLYYGMIGNFKSHVVRLSNGIGYPLGVMHQDNLLVPDLCRSAIFERLITLKSNPNTKRDFIAIADIVTAVGYLLKYFTAINNGVYNLSSGQSTTIKEMAELIQSLCIKGFNFKPELIFLSNHSAIIAEDYNMSNDKFLNEGFTFKNDYNKEIVGLLNYYKNQAIKHA